MAIEKMKFVCISGLLNDFDRVMKTVVGKSEIHLENANDVFKNISSLQKFPTENTYAPLKDKMKEILAYLGSEAVYDKDKVEDINFATYEKKENEIIAYLKEKSDNIDKMKIRLEEDKEISAELDYFIGYNVDIYSFFHLKTMRFRFGALPTYNYEKMQNFINDIDAVVIKLKESDTETHIMYFCSNTSYKQTDEIFKKLMFRRIKISDRVSGQPEVAKKNIDDEIKELENEIALCNANLEDYKTKLRENITVMYSSIKYNYYINAIRSKVARGNSTFHMTGFMPEKAAKLLEKIFSDDSTTIIQAENPDKKAGYIPPTKLKNPRVIRPFETIVELFSLPGYGEIDPTPMVAIIYSLLFGIMFADVGQGLFFAVAGLLLYKFKKVKLFGVVGTIGFFSAFFGFLFGSVFGDENIIKPLLFNPMDNSDKMMTTLIAAIAIGFLLLIMAMIFNLVNSYKRHDKEQLFTNNGLVGLIFYFSAGAIGVLSFLKGHYIAPVAITLICLLLPLVLIFLKGPIMNVIDKRKEKIDGTYFAESFFEVFESLLSYVTNTMSFVRVGAFALNHIGMMSVFYILAQNSAGASHWAIIVFGNIIVMGLEGLIVGIQVLRLMFYELFSKFYTGGGRAYEPFKID